MEEKSTLVILNKRTGKLETFNIHTGELVATEGEVVSKFLYSIELAQAIANEVRGGNTLSNIASMDNMPPLFIIYNWRETHPEFKSKLKQARRDRAFYFEDKAIEAVKEAEGAAKEDIPSLKLRLDGFTKLAEKANPEDFMPKAQALIGGAAPAMIVINTGISRDVIEIEANDEKICIDRREKNPIRRVDEEAGSDKGFGAETDGLPDVLVRGSEASEESLQEEIKEESE